MIDTNSQEHLLNCLARHIIGELRQHKHRPDREEKFRYMTRRYSKEMQSDLQERVRLLWNEKNPNG